MSCLKSAINPRDAGFKANAAATAKLVDELKSRMGEAAQGGDALGGALPPALVEVSGNDVEHRDVAAARGECQRHRPAEPAPGTGDRNRLALDLHRCALAGRKRYAYGGAR